MEEIKSWWQSRTIWGSLISGSGGVMTFAAGVMQYFHDHPDQQATLWNATHALMDNVTAAATVVGAFMAWYGRVNATTTIGKK